MTNISEQYHKALQRLYANKYKDIVDKVNDWNFITRALDELERLKNDECE